jgi:hypothetical protein
VRWLVRVALEWKLLTAMTSLALAARELRWMATGWQVQLA